jgi:hypothetical protein
MTIKVPFQGSIVDGEEVSFKTIREEWNEYETEDGSTIRVKLVMANIVRLKDRLDATGTPIYALKSTNVVAVSPPDKSKKGTSVS